MAQEKKERIFISYKRVDKERVFAIKDGIEQATGEKCWIDLDGIESDAQFVTKIMTAIDQCDVFLFMRSNAHNKIVDLKRDWTYREVNYALKKEKSIVFINLDNSQSPDWVSFMFPHQQEMDATDPEKLARLNKDLCERLGIGPTLEPDPAELEKAKREVLPEGEFQVGDLMYKASENSNGVTVAKYVDKEVTEIHIPSQIKYGNYIYNVDAIGNEAFGRCLKLSSITIPNSVTAIGDMAFYWCRCLTSVSIPNSVTILGNMSFSRCFSLTSLVIPDSVMIIRDGAFRGCKGLTSVTIGNSVTSIGDEAFAGCYSLKSVKVPRSVTYIGIDAFPTFKNQLCQEDIVVQEKVMRWITECGLVEDGYYSQLTDAICGPQIILSLKLPNLDQANSDEENKQGCQRYLAYLGNFPTDKQISIMLDAFKTQLDDKIHALLQEIDGIYNALKFVELFKTYCEKYKSEMDSEVESFTKQKAEREDAFDKKAYSNYISEKHGALTFGRATKNQELLEDLVGRPAREILQLTYEIRRREVASSIYNTLIAQADELSEKLENMDGSLQ
jgi:hypothetical protein